MYIVHENGEGIIILLVRLLLTESRSGNRPKVLEVGSIFLPPGSHKLLGS